MHRIRRGRRDTVCDVRAKSRALEIVEPLMRLALDDVSGEAGKLLVGLACEILRRAVEIVAPYNHKTLLEFLTSIKDWSKGVVEYPAILDAKKDWEARSTEKLSALDLIVQQLFRAALYNDVGWVASQSTGDCDGVYRKAGITSAFLICYHEAAEIAAELCVGASFASIQNSFTDNLIIQALAKAGINQPSPISQSQRVITTHTWQEIVSSGESSTTQPPGL